MKNNRRDFFKFSGLAGVGLASSGLTQGCGTQQAGGRPLLRSEIYAQASKAHGQRFNMCNHAAPRLETVRLGFIGLGEGPPTPGRESETGMISMPFTYPPSGICTPRSRSMHAVEGLSEF